MQQDGGSQARHHDPRGTWPGSWRRSAANWLPAIEKAGIRGLRVHDMRHSAMSWWANSGVPLADVRDRAGHFNISVTSRYIHVMPGDANPFAAFLGEAA
ncbi:MAG TPA: tyrosine-type recombinase/integrase [Trebonia sp.]